MNGCLLDTNVALIALSQPERLTSRVRSTVLRGPNILSAVTFWEVMLKARQGKLDVGDPRLWWAKALADLAATSLPVRPEHVAELDTIPEHHGDPFDRVLVAQAMIEGLALVTTDRDISRYASDRLRVVR